MSKRATKQTQEIAWTNIRVKLGQLRPWSENPRMSSKKQAARILESFTDFGQVQTIAVSPSFDVYDGHQRLSALLTLYGKDYEIDARQSSRALIDAERRRLVIALHAGAQGAWDWDALSGWDDALLSSAGMDADLLEQMNRDAIALREMLAAAEVSGANDADAEPQMDKADELREKWQTARGQVWQLGEHRLMCGDSVDDGDIARLAGSDTFRAVVTSPPYAAQRKYKTEAFDWLQLANGFFAALVSHTGKAADVLVNLGITHRDAEVDFYWNEWLAECKRIGWPLYGWYVWDKGNGMPGEWNGRLAPAHEFIFHFSVGRKSARKWIDTNPDSAKRSAHKHSSRKKDGSLKAFTSPGKIGQAFKVPDSVIRINKEHARGLHTETHPAVFSVEFASFLIQTWSDAGDVVYEPFSGSGTTIIACEQLGRKCRAMEIAPEYVAVTLQRWADATGKTPAMIDTLDTQK